MEQQGPCIVLRYDDYSADPRWKSFEAAFANTIEALQIPIVYSVVPRICECAHDPSSRIYYPLTSAEVQALDPLLAKGLVEIAQHGYTHQHRSGASPWTEFVGAPFAEQVERIGAGRRQLESLFGREVTTFVPPWNAYDSVTVDALRTLNFRCVSAGNTVVPADFGAIQFIPQTCRLDSDRVFYKAVQESLAWSDDALLIVFTLHSYNFVEANSARGQFSIHTFTDMIRRARDQLGLQFVSFTDVIALRGAECLAATKCKQQMGRIEKLLPSRVLGKVRCTSCLPSHARLIVTARRRWIGSALWFGSLTAVGVLSGLTLGVTTAGAGIGIQRWMMTAGMGLVMGCEFLNRMAQASGWRRWASRTLSLSCCFAVVLYELIAGNTGR